MSKKRRSTKGIIKECTKQVMEEINTLSSITMHSNLASRIELVLTSHMTQLVLLAQEKKQ